MKIDKIFMLYKNSGKFYDSYDEAYFQGQKLGYEKTVYYVFTPTMQEFKNVKDLYIHAKSFFRSSYNCDYLDIITRRTYKQLKLIGDL